MSRRVLWFCCFAALVGCGGEKKADNPPVTTQQRKPFLDEDLPPIIIETSGDNKLKKQLAPNTDKPVPKIHIKRPAADAYTITVTGKMVISTFVVKGNQATYTPPVLLNSLVVTIGEGANEAEMVRFTASASDGTFTINQAEVDPPSGTDDKGRDRLQAKRKISKYTLNGGTPVDDFHNLVFVIEPKPE